MQEIIEKQKWGFLKKSPFYKSYIKLRNIENGKIITISPIGKLMLDIIVGKALNNLVNINRAILAHHIVIAISINFLTQLIIECVAIFLPKLRNLNLLHNSLS